MVTEWLATALASGGSALAGAAATDVWQTARSGVAKLFGRGGERRRELAERLADQMAGEILSAAPAVQDQVRERWAAAWEQRLADLVEEYPEASDDLRSWVEEVRAQLPATQREWVNTFIAQGQATQYNAPGGSMTINNITGINPPA